MKGQTKLKVSFKLNAKKVRLIYKEATRFMHPVS